MNKFLAKLCVFATLIIFFASCDSKDDNESSVNDKINDIVKLGMLKIDKGVGNWDFGIICDAESYLLYEQNEDDDIFDYISISSAEEDVDCGIFVNPADGLPGVVSFDDETFLFDNIGDSILEVSKMGVEDIEYLGSIPISYDNGPDYSRGKASVLITYEPDKDMAKRAAGLLWSIIDNGGTYNSSNIEHLKRVLNKIFLMRYYDDVESVLDELELCAERYKTDNDVDSLVYCFASNAEKSKIRYHDPVKYGLSLRFENAYNIKSNSANISGRVFCASNHFDSLGKYGIVYSKSPNDFDLSDESKLVYARGNHNGNFSVRLSNLEPNTTYYYKAFYKFDSGNHGDIVFSYGPQKAASYMTSSTKSFVTQNGEFPVKITKLEVEGENNRCTLSEDGELTFSFNLKASAKRNSDVPLINWGLDIYKPDGGILKNRHLFSSKKMDINRTFDIPYEKFTYINGANYKAYWILKVVPAYSNEGETFRSDSEQMKVEYNAIPGVKLSNVRIDGETTDNPYGYDYCTLFHVDVSYSGILFAQRVTINWFGDGCVEKEDNVNAIEKWGCPGSERHITPNMYFGYTNDSQSDGGDVYLQFNIYTRFGSVISSDILHFYNDGTKLRYKGGITKSQSKASIEHDSSIDGTYAICGSSN